MLLLGDEEGCWARAAGVGEVERVGCGVEWADEVQRSNADRTYLPLGSPLSTFPPCLSLFQKHTSNSKCAFTILALLCFSSRQLQHILRLLNTNVDGKRKVMYALTEIKGVGRRYSNLVCKKADVDLNKR